MKKKLGMTFGALLCLLVAAIFWMWWTKPLPVEMARTVPAETLVYLEANDLPRIISGLASTEAWKILAPRAGLSDYAARADQFSRLPFYTGLGGAEAVVLSRAQIAVAVLGFDASEAGEGFRVRPSVALVMDTRSSAEQTNRVIRQYADQFARQTFGEVDFEQRPQDDFLFSYWKSTTGGKQVVAATRNSVGVIGNDEAAVAACVQAIKGVRQSLADNSQMRAMRQRMLAPGAATFGYASPLGLTKLIESVTHAYSENVTDQRAQGLAASLLPQISGRVIGAEGAGWSAVFADGFVDDNFYVSLQPGLTDQLRKIPKSGGDAFARVAEALPRDTYQVTRYPYESPESAWRALNVSLASRLDAFSSVLVVELLKSALEPYGIPAPNEFLRAVGPEVVVARLDDSGVSTVTILTPRDEKALRALLGRRLGARAKTLKVGDAELIISSDEERGGAAFSAGLLLLGSEKSLRRCLEAGVGRQTFADAVGYRRTVDFVAKFPGEDAVTVSDERENTVAMMAALVQNREKKAAFLGDQNQRQALQSLPLSMSLTRLVEGGAERRTRSSFGQFGNLLTQLAQPPGAAAE
ncbi:MAG TPA: hypothetical protein VM870_05250 [Pyrinomonadaceae bacterium]|jgi:hypothetical protein|nr:hypothetical protein [Pyrinomonadaceae bacterium]